jgi:hypothetical protein
MARKRVSSVDLSWMIFERLRDEFGRNRPISVAVVSDRELGWRAVLAARGRTKDVVRKLRLIEKEFRSAYSLARD